MKEETSIYQKLFEAKKTIGTLTKDSKNPFFKNNYLSLNGLLEAVEVVLLNNNLVLLQPITEGKVTTRIIDIDNGGCVSSEMQLPNIQDAQKLGSAITYFRRYTLESLLGLSAVDDDGQNAVKPIDYTRHIHLLKGCKTHEELNDTFSKFTLDEQAIQLLIDTAREVQKELSK
jgi:hypothetical protein